MIIDDGKAYGYAEYAALWGDGSSRDGCMFYNFAEQGNDAEFLRYFIPAIDRLLSSPPHSDNSEQWSADKARGLGELRAECERRLVRLWGEEAEAILGAAHYLFSVAYANELENAGGSFSPGTQILEVAPMQPDETMLSIMEEYLSRIESVWGIEPILLFREVMQLEWGDVEHALHDTLMGCWGHGINLDDDFSEVREEAERKLNRPIDPTPFEDEFMELTDLAYQVVQDELRGGDGVDDGFADEVDIWVWDGLPGEQPMVRGQAVLVKSDMPPGDTLTCRANLHRVYRTRRGRTEVVVHVDEEYPVEPPSYAGSFVVVDMDEIKPNF
jgi:hypothetical protein